MADRDPRFAPLEVGITPELYEEIRDLWLEHVTAREFYETFIPSFEGMQWVPQALVIGPQGVLDVADMTATLVRPFAGLEAVGEVISTEWVIHFPWDPERHRFRGETIYSIRRTG